MKHRYEISCREDYQAFRRLVWVVIVLVTLVCLCSCTAPRMVPERFENKLIMTRQYAGKLILCRPEGKYTTVLTTDGYFTVCGELHGIDGTLCYIRIVPCLQDVHPDIAARLKRMYFNYNGIEYRVKTW